MSTGNEVKLLSDDIIYVEKHGNQTAAALITLSKKIEKLAALLRSQNKPILILSNAQDEGAMTAGARNAAAKIGKTLDFDRSATYTSSAYLHNLRDLMARVNSLDQKVANFETRAEALAWLLSYKKS